MVRRPQDLGYVSVWDGGLQILDLRDPARPALLGGVATAGMAGDLAVVGGRAYVLIAGGVPMSPHALQIIDVGDPVRPAALGTFAPLPQARGVAVAGDIAYVAAWEGGLSLVDVGDPAAPALIGQVPEVAHATDVAVVGGRAYVTSTTGLQIFDLRDLRAPALLGAVGLEGLTSRVQVAGDVAYVSAAGLGIHRIDVLDPAAPALIGLFDLATQSLAEARFQVVGGIASIASNQRGLQIFDVGDPAAPQALGAAALAAWGGAYGIDVAGDTAYVAAGDDGLQIVDLAEPGRPALLGRYTASGFVRHVLVRGAVAYVAGAGVSILDVSDPARPALLARIADASGISAIAVAGERLYVGAEPDGGLQVFDVRDPAGPALLGGYGYPVVADLAVVEDRAYVSVTGHEVEILDVGNPAQIHMVGVYTADEAMGAIAVAGPYLYIATMHQGAAGLRVVDLGDPAAPARLGRYDTPNTARDVLAAGGAAYLIDAQGGLYQLDVGDPAAPALVARHPVAEPWALRLAGERLYVATGAGGVLVFAPAGR